MANIDRRHPIIKTQNFFKMSNLKPFKGVESKIGDDEFMVYIPSRRETILRVVVLITRGGGGYCLNMRRELSLEMTSGIESYFSGEKNFVNLFNILYY